MALPEENELKQLPSRSKRGWGQELNKTTKGRRTNKSSKCGGKRWDLCCCPGVRLIWGPLKD